MFNFASSKLLPKVHADVPSLDNYEVTNLISGSNVRKSRGFIAFSTIKPPVEVTFELLCPININYISLSTSVGTQKCTAIEVLAKKFHEPFVSIGYAKFDNSGIVFCNRRFYSIINPPSHINKSYTIDFFKRSSYKSFIAANFIKVRIVQTERSSVPCLGKIEIWGKPSALCSLTTLNTINRLVHHVNHCHDDEPTNEVLVPIGLEIPDEFKDALTFEVMSVPLTLPSGNTIDQRSLEKYLANEASYGRSASDPFTGLAFTEIRKPILNTALKSRIDVFLLQHSAKPETFTIQRTLGKRAPSNENDVLTVKKIKHIENYSDINSADVKDPDKFLDEAIKKTMNSSGFVQFTTVDKNTGPVVPNCSKCKNTTRLYIMPCDHLYCRDCLLIFPNHLNCNLCDKKLLRSDAKKFHF